MSEQVIEYIKYVIWVLLGSGLVFEVTPIKIKPISLILGWIGKKLNKDVKEDISQLETKIITVQKDLQNHIVESQRRNILMFADELMRGDQKTEESYNVVIKLHDNYEKYTKENNIENGQIVLAFKYISKKYQECRDNNSFYVGK